MITLTPDPLNPDKLILTQTITLYLDRILLETLDDAIALAIQEQAAKDLRTGRVRKQIMEAATKLLLDLLHVKEPNGITEAT